MKQVTLTPLMALELSLAGGILVNCIKFLVLDFAGALRRTFADDRYQLQKLQAKLVQDKSRLETIKRILSGLHDRSKFLYSIAAGEIERSDDLRQQIIQYRRDASQEEGTLRGMGLGDSGTILASNNIRQALLSGLEGQRELFQRLLDDNTKLEGMYSEAALLDNEISIAQVSQSLGDLVVSADLARVELSKEYEDARWNRVGLIIKASLASTYVIAFSVVFMKWIGLLARV